jgi:hypothetical protein
VTRPGLPEGVAVALAVSVIGSGTLLLLAPVTGRGVALHVVIAAGALAYLVYLLLRGRARAGRVVVPAAWAVLSAVVLLADVAPAWHLLAQAGLVWLTRSWCFQAGVLGALADLGVIAAGLAAFVWAAHHSESLALAIWSLMLVQSVFVLLPSHRRAHVVHGSDARDDFERAHRAAESALRDLYGRV